MSTTVSNTVRNGVTIVMLLLLAASAFVAGYVAKDYLAMHAVNLPGQATSAVAEKQFDVFWEVWTHLENNFIGELPTSKEVAYAAIRGVISVLGDPYTTFVEPVAREEERERLQGKFGGVGVMLSRREESGEVVLEPIPGNPAEKAGILSGDVLLAVDGQSIPPEMTMAALTELIKGEKGSSVTLTVRHPQVTEPVDVVIVRDDILIPSVTFRLLTEAPEIGYIQLTRFSGESSREVQEAIVALQAQGMEKLVLDVRQNGGGLLDAAVEVADHFLQDGPILYQQSKRDGEREFEATSESVAPDLPLIVLVDQGTASASEILAGALQDRQRALLIGSSKTFGKGSVQLVFDLTDGSSVHVTSARWFTPNRSQIDQQGLVPDILVELTQEGIDNGRDEVLKRTIEYFRNGR